MGATAVGGSLIAAVVSHRLRRPVVVLTGFLLAGAPRFLILAFDDPLWVELAVFAVSGFGAGFVNQCWQPSSSSGCRAGCWAGSTRSVTRWPGPVPLSAGCSPERR